MSLSKENTYSKLNTTNNFRRQDIESFFNQINFLEDPETNRGKLQYYYEELNFFFSRYLMGALTLEQFVEVTNNPSRAYKEYHRKNYLNSKFKRRFAMVTKKIVHQKLKAKNKEVQQLPDKRDKLMKANTYLYDVIESIRNNKSIWYRQNPSSAMVVAKIHKLKTLLKQKKQRRVDAAEHFSNLKFYDLTISIANDVLKKIEGSNLIDHSTVHNDFGQRSKLHLFNNFAVKQKLDRSSMDVDYSKNKNQSLDKR